MTTEELKRLWDAEWPPNEIIDGVMLEEVHFELNLRGEGRYCAV